MYAAEDVPAVRVVRLTKPAVAAKKVAPLKTPAMVRQAHHPERSRGTVAVKRPVI